MTIFGKIRPVGAGAGIILSLVLALFVAGCSSGTGTSGAGLGLVDSQGNHPASFLSTHPSFAVSNVEQCKPCHGDDLTGGIANTSCFTAACHHGTTPGWENLTVHGAAAKRAPGNSGFKSCQICHGSDFTGDGSGIACSDCHGVPAPHPAAPWRAAANPTHTNTDPANAPVCAACHFPESANNPANHPLDPAPSGTAPDCFNNTLCHGQSAAPHILGAAWLDPSVGGADFHGLTAKLDLSYCQSCHSQPGTIAFAGGSAATSCAGCHPEARAHPFRWYQAPQDFPNYVPSHRNSGNRDAACAICHDVTLGRTAPDDAAPSCFAGSFQGVSCHSNGPGQPNHSTPFLDAGHTGADIISFNNDCRNCHAESGTSPLSGAPTCTTCHGEGEKGGITPLSPLTNFNCSSCHTEPPSGSVYPNIGGEHSFHLGLDAAPGNTVSCDTCHSGFGSGSRNHYDRANARPGNDILRVPPGDLQFLPDFDAKGGKAGFDCVVTSPGYLTCSNVSCHGGQRTPNWRTGSIPETTDAGCRQCHVLGSAQGVPEYNSPFSGLHQFHLQGISSSTGGNALCTECHAMANGTAGANNHFRSLNTRDQLEGPASDTIVPDDKDAAVPAGSYTVKGQTCDVTCHGQTHTGFSWTGGANHTIPFLDPRHTSMNAIDFPDDCGTCHQEGTTPELSSVPPTCRTCHQAASPLVAANCTSCHTSPPNGLSTGDYPNVEGGHDEHNALGGITGIDHCNACHTGYTSGDLPHYDRANARSGRNDLRVPPGDVGILSTYFGNPVTAGAFFDNLSTSSTYLTCTNVSCHGAITTPNWQTGTINVNVDSGPGVTPVSGCRQCHTLGTALGTPQNNSAWSGFHQKHLQAISGRPGGNALCTECHDMANGTAGANNHFANLATAVMEGPAGQTVRPDDKDPGVPAGTYATSTRTCTVTCHTQDHSGWRWDGPAADHLLGSAWTDPAPGFHGLTAKSDLTACRSCHSQPGTIAFAGGSATTSCASCHPDARAHPVRWFEAPQGFPNYVPSHRDAGNRDVACAICHDVTQGRPAPDLGAPSCFSASFKNVGCHSGGPGAPNHAVPNLEATHLEAVQGDFDGNCSHCHSDTGSSTVSTAPNCASCHTNFASSSPLDTKDCTSCHGDPPTGTTYPNIARKHAKHNALPEVFTVCSACHNGLDPSIGVADNQLAHYNLAKTRTGTGNVAILSTYNAKSGTASFTSLSCSNVSCHGGIAINWDTDSIAVNTDAGCPRCHTRGTTQYNSQNSGQHAKHGGGSFGCTECHNMALATPGAQNHFAFLSTSTMEGPAKDTFQNPGITYTPSTPGNGNCTGSCHGKNHSNENW